MEPNQNKINKIVLTLFLFTFTFLLVTCNTTEPPIVITPPKPAAKDTLTIKIADKTHRSITVNVKTTANKTGTEIKLIRKKEGGADTLVSKYSVSTLDTTIIDDNNGNGLQLNTAYTYYAVRVDSSGAAKDSSGFVTAQTLAATSHNYTWQQIIIGDDGYNNALYDVWGTDENNVYAVGGVTINDTTYGVIHWDGNMWKGSLLRGGLFSVFGFSSSDIWVVGNGVAHYNGIHWEEITNDNVLNNNVEYTSLWGTSSNNLYLGNLRRNIVHWDGSSGTVEQIPEDIVVFDIQGTDNNFIIAAGNDLYWPGYAFTKNSNTWVTIPQLVYAYIDLESVYIVNNKEAYLCGSGIIDYIDGKSTLHSDITTQALNKIRGNKESGDIFTVGYKEVLHYNGVDWHSYRTELSIINESDLKSVYVTESKVFIIGEALIDNKYKTIILIGSK